MKKITAIAILFSLIFLASCEKEQEVPAKTRPVPQPVVTKMKGIVKKVRVVYENKKGGASNQQSNTNYLQLTGKFVNCIVKIDVNGKPMYAIANENIVSEIQHLCASLQEGDEVSIIRQPDASGVYTMYFSGLDLKEAIDF